MHNEVEDPNMILIAKDLGAFYKFNGDQTQTLKYKEKYTEFKKKKLFEIEFQEIIMRIGVYVSKSELSCNFLLENSFFFDDIIEYLQGLVAPETIYGIKKDFIDFVLEKKKKLNSESIKKLITSILENSLVILFQTMSNEHILDYFVDKVIDN